MIDSVAVVCKRVYVFENNVSAHAAHMVVLEEASRLGYRLAGRTKTDTSGCGRMIFVPPKRALRRHLKKSSVGAGVSVPGGRRRDHCRPGAAGVAPAEEQCEESASLEGSVQYSIWCESENALVDDCAHQAQGSASADCRKCYSPPPQRDGSRPEEEESSGCYSPSLTTTKHQLRDELALTSVRVSRNSGSVYVSVENVVEPRFVPALDARFETLRNTASGRTGPLDDHSPSPGSVGRSTQNSGGGLLAALSSWGRRSREEDTSAVAHPSHVQPGTTPGRLSMEWELEDGKFFKRDMVAYTGFSKLLSPSPATSLLEGSATAAAADTTSNQLQQSSEKLQRLFADEVAHFRRRCEKEIRGLDDLHRRSLREVRGSSPHPLAVLAVQKRLFEETHRQKNSEAGASPSSSQIFDIPYMHLLSHDDPLVTALDRSHAEVSVWNPMQHVRQILLRVRLECVSVELSVHDGRGVVLVGEDVEMEGWVRP